MGVSFEPIFTGAYPETKVPQGTTIIDEQGLPRGNNHEVGLLL